MCLGAPVQAGRNHPADAGGHPVVSFSPRPPLAAGLRVCLVRDPIPFSLSYVGTVKLARDKICCYFRTRSGGHPSRSDLPAIMEIHLRPRITRRGEAKSILRIQRSVESGWIQVEPMKVKCLKFVFQESGLGGYLFVISSTGH